MEGESLVFPSRIAATAITEQTRTLLPIAKITRQSSVHLFFNLGDLLERFFFVAV